MPRDFRDDPRNKDKIPDPGICDTEDVSFPCLDGRYFVDPTSCYHYYVCAKTARLIRFKCGSGTAWNHVTRACEDNTFLIVNRICDLANPESRCPPAQPSVTSGVTFEGQTTRVTAPTTTPSTRTPTPFIRISRGTGRNTKPAIQTTSQSNPFVPDTTGSRSIRETTSKDPDTTHQVPISDKTTHGSVVQPQPKPQTGARPEIIAVAVLGSLIFVALVIVAIFLYRRKRINTTREKKKSPGVHNPEYARRPSGIYSEIHNTETGSISTITRDNALSKNFGRPLFLPGDNRSGSLGSTSSTAPLTGPMTPLTPSAPTPTLPSTLPPMTSIEDTIQEEHFYEKLPSEFYVEGGMSSAINSPLPSLPSPPDPYIRQSIGDDNGNHFQYPSLSSAHKPGYETIDGRKVVSIEGHEHGNIDRLPASKRPPSQPLPRAPFSQADQHALPTVSSMPLPQPSRPAPAAPPAPLPPSVGPVPPLVAPKPSSYSVIREA